MRCAWAPAPRRQFASVQFVSNLCDPQHEVAALQARLLLESGGPRRASVLVGGTTAIRRRDPAGACEERDLHLQEKGPEVEVSCQVP